VKKQNNTKQKISEILKDLRITNPVSDLTGDQLFYTIFRSCDFGNHHIFRQYDFLMVYGICYPYNPPHKPEKKNHTTIKIVGELQPRRPIFEKCSHLREKRGVLMLSKTTLHLQTNPQYSIQGRNWFQKLDENSGTHLTRQISQSELQGAPGTQMRATALPRLPWYGRVVNR
jgi:hypothetical protein